MKRRMMSWLLAASMLLTVLTPVQLVWAEEEEAELTLSTPVNEGVQSKDESEKSETESALDSILNSNVNVMGALGQKDWEALADAVKKSGDWREDLVAVAQSQVGYEEDADGMTLYTKWSGYGSAREWTALFVNWVANKAGLSTSEFPRGTSYASVKDKMSSLNAVKKIELPAYPVSGDLALIDLNGQQLVGVVVYVNNGYAYVIHGDDNGAVTGKTYAVGQTGFTRYVDLNVLMALAGVETGQGGEVPEIPEGGVTGWTNTNSVYMRKEPTTASKRVTMVKKANTELLVTSASLQGDGYIWYGVEYDRYTGYIRGDLVELDTAALATATPEPTEAPTATPTAEPTNTPEPTEAPTVEPTNTPEPTEAPTAEPTATPEPAAESTANLCEGYEVECQHVANIRALPVEERAAYLNALYVDPDQVGDEVTDDELILEAVMLHIWFYHYDENLVCTCGEYPIPAYGDPVHTQDCPWYVAAGLSVQERVVNITVQYAAAGEQVTILYELDNANESTTYQWYQVAEEGDILLEGETGASLTLTAGKENNGKQYYCVASNVVFNGETLKMTSKITTLNVDSTPITAEAIAGEEINFTYEYEGAAAYQWYGPVLQEDGTYAVQAISGATGATYTTSAIIAVYKANLTWYCEALDENGAVLGTSGYFTYTILAGAEYMQLYIAELINMTREQRYVALTETWNVKLSEISGVAEDIDVISEQVMLTWYGMGEGYEDLYPGMQEEYPDLLCTCVGSGLIDASSETLLLHPHDSHDSTCPWYVPAVNFFSASSDTEEDTDADLSVFYECATFPEECELVTGWIEDNASPMTIYNDLVALKAEPGYTASGDEYDMVFAALMHTAAHEDAIALMCTCVEDMYSNLIIPGNGHAEDCAWYIAGVDGDTLAARIESEAEFAAWAETATDAMIARALAAKSLNHLVLETADDGNTYLYVAREENPRATVDEDGYVTDISSGLVIAQIVDGKLVALY